MQGVVGWEKNDKGQLGPRLANMRSSMDPVKIAKTSVDLNLKLMKWRLELQLDKIIAARLRDLGLCSVQGPPGRTITLVDRWTMAW